MAIKKPEGNKEGLFQDKRIGWHEGKRHKLNDDFSTLEKVNYE
jgi:hypothetical protein